MTNKAKNNLIEQITSEFTQLENVFSNIQNLIYDLVSVRRRCDKASTDSLNDTSDIANYVDINFLQRVQSSFHMTVTEAIENLADEVSCLLGKTSKIISLLESLTEVLQVACNRHLDRFIIYTEILQAIGKIRSCLIDEIDLVSYWAYSHISPALVPQVSDAFIFLSSCMSVESMTFTVWRDELSPLLLQHSV